MDGRTCSGCQGVSWLMVATSPRGIAMKRFDFAEVVTRQRLHWSFPWESWPRVKRPWRQGSQQGQALSITWRKSFRVQKIRISVEYGKSPDRMMF